MTRREIFIGAAGAVGGGAIKVVSDIIMSNRTRANNAAEKAQALLESFGKAYDDLGDLPRQAVEFAETGRGGSANDVRVMARHFARLVQAVTSKAIAPEAAALQYANHLRGWGKRFIDIAERSVPSASKFSDVERYNFRLLGPALRALANESSDNSTGIAEVDQYATESNATSTEFDANGM